MHSVDNVYDGEAALLKISHHCYEILILDYRLSGLSGLSILENSRQINPSNEAIMISAFGNESVRAKAKELGAYAFLDKPFHIDRLKKTVKKALIEQKRRCANEANLHKVACLQVGVLVLLMSILVLPVFAAEQTAVAQKTGIQSILEPVKLSTDQVSGYLPKLGGLFLILVAGSLIALGVAALIGLILKTIRLEKAAKKINILEILKKGGIELSLSGLITEVIFFVIIIATLITALEYYGVETSIFTGQILAYIPRVIAAVFILVLGIFLSLLISGIITLVGGNIRIAQSAILGNIAKYAILVVSSLIALNELGAGIILTDQSKDIVLVGLVLFLALGFGLGLKGKAEDFLGKILKN
ncbi:MAG: response regulator [Candidatus Omnitrophota bacterium]